MISDLPVFTNVISFLSGKMISYQYKYNCNLCDCEREATDTPFSRIEETESTRNYLNHLSSATFFEIFGL